MTINDINLSVANMFEIVPTAQNEWQLKTPATFQNGEPLNIFIVKDQEEWYLTDKKATLQYMNMVYDLKAPDVKSCIAAVIKIYGFAITAGTLKANIIDEVDLQSKIFDYIMCIGQLTNMYAFFDKPE